MIRHLLHLLRVLVAGLFPLLSVAQSNSLEFAFSHPGDQRGRHVLRTSTGVALLAEDRQIAPNGIPLSQHILLATQAAPEAPLQGERILLPGNFANVHQMEPLGPEAWLATGDGSASGGWVLRRNADGSRDFYDVPVNGRLLAAEAPDGELVLCREFGGSIRLSRGDYATQTNVQQLDGSFSLLPREMAIAADGSIYVLGNTFSEHQSTLYRRPFIARFAPDLSLSFATYLGNPGAEHIALALELGPEGEVFVAGATQALAPEYPADDYDACIWSMNNDNLVLWQGIYRENWFGHDSSLFMAYPEFALDLKLGPNRELFVTGYRDYFENFLDAILLKVNATNGFLLESTRAGGTGPEIGRSIWLNPAENSLTITGETRVEGEDIFLGTYSLALDHRPCFAEPVPTTAEDFVLPQPETDPGFSTSARNAFSLTPFSPGFSPVTFKTVRYGPAIELTTKNVSCFGADDGEIRVEGTGLGPFGYFIGDPSEDEFYPKVADSVFTNLAPGNYRLAISDQLGCTAFGDTTITEPPPLELSTNLPLAAVCPGDSTTLEFSASGGTPPYRFVLEEDTLPTAGASAGTYPIASPGDFILHLADSNGCTLQDTGALAKVPPIVLPPTDTLYLPVEARQPAQFPLPQASPPGGEWSGELLGPGRASLQLDADTRPGRYALEYTYSGCQDTTSVVVKEPDIKLFIPNAFSPNGDGTNDEFSFFVPRHKAYRLQIWSRNGEQVFAAERHRSHWDGTWQNQPATEGVYVYRLWLTLPGGATIERSGTVVLLR